MELWRHWKLHLYLEAARGILKVFENLWVTITLLSQQQRIDCVSQHQDNSEVLRQVFDFGLSAFTTAFVPE
jgi:hypothetical protein